MCGRLLAEDIERTSKQFRRMMGQNKHISLGINIMIKARLEYHILVKMIFFLLIALYSQSNMVGENKSVCLGIAIF